MPTGTVAKWLNHKGVGFITPTGETEGENDLLVHHTEIKQGNGDGFKTLNVGSTVEFTVATDPKNPEKKVATGVSGVDGADCDARVKGRGKKGQGKKDDADGTVAKWLNHKGIGFITPKGEVEGENDLLVHHSEIKQVDGDGFKKLKVGSSVNFTVGTDPQNPEKKVATEVTVVDVADRKAKVKGKGKGKKGQGKKDDAVPEERRIDPEDGLAYTWDDISTHYNRKYKKKEIAAYWEDMKPAKKGRKGKNDADKPAKGKKGKKSTK